MPAFSTLDIFDLAPDDLIWSVGCTYADFVAFLNDPIKWLAAVTQEAHRQHVLDPATSLVLADHYSVQVRPTFPAEADTVSHDLAGFLGLSLQDRLNKLTAVERADLEKDRDASTFLIYGISGTGYVSVEPGLDTVIAQFILNPDWDGFWSAWKSNLSTTGATVVLPATRYAYTHIDITEDGDAKRAEKIAAFLVGASRSTWHLNDLLAVKPKAYRFPKGTPANDPLMMTPPPYASVTSASLSTVAFNYIG